MIAVTVFLIFLYRDIFFSLNLENIYSEYEKLGAFLDNNKLISIGLYLFISTIWICFVGIVSPLLLISTVLFGYFGIPLSIFSFILGSMFTFTIANL